VLKIIISSKICETTTRNRLDYLEKSAAAHLSIVRLIAQRGHISEPATRTHTHTLISVTCDNSSSSTAASDAAWRNCRHQWKLGQQRSPYIKILIANGHSSLGSVSP